MRNALSFAAALAIAGCAGPILDRSVATRSTEPADRAAIEAIEADWSRAFLARDYARIDQIVAPEYKLLGWRNGKLDVTPRSEWMANLRRFDFRAYETKLLDLVVVDDTAVATLSGNWTVGVGGKYRPNSRFLVTDTWVRRDGGWQIVLRNAQTLD